MHNDKHFDRACDAIEGSTTNGDDDGSPNNECVNASARLESAPAKCIPDSDMDSLTEQVINAVCSCDCRPFYDDVAANCQIEEVCMYLRTHTLLNIQLLTKYCTVYVRS